MNNTYGIINNGILEITDLSADKTGKIENSRLFSFEVWKNENLVQNFELNFYENEYNLFNDLVIKIFKT